MACQTPTRTPKSETILCLNENNNVSLSDPPCAMADKTDFRGLVTVASNVGCSPDIVFK
jgi:hypothetical protein